MNSLPTEERREQIARMVDPNAFANWHRYYLTRQNADFLSPEKAKEAADYHYGEDVREAYARADRILALPSPTVETVNGEMLKALEHIASVRQNVPGGITTNDALIAMEAMAKSAIAKAARASAPAGADGWKDISTAPNDSGFRWYGLYVKHATGAGWFEAHYLSHDDDGQMIESSGDHFTDWEFSDFEFWCAAPPPPAPIAEK